MTFSTRHVLYLFLTGLFLLLGAASCSSSDKMMCERDRTYKTGHSSRNHYNYSNRYGSKSKPAKKDYVIRNKRTGKKY